MYGMVTAKRAWMDTAEEAESGETKPQYEALKQFFMETSILEGSIDVHVSAMCQADRSGEKRSFKAMDRCSIDMKGRTVPDRV